MNQTSLTRFIFLGAISGSSFLFIRIIAPVFGGFRTAQFQLAIGAVTLLVLMRVFKLPLNLHHWRHYMALGVLNCAFPYAMIGFAGRTLPAGYLAVLSSTVPLWATLCGVCFLKNHFTLFGVLALILCFVGVGLIAQPSEYVQWDFHFIVGMFACLSAALSHALCGVYIRTKTKGVSPQSMAAMSQLFGAIFLLPAAILFSPTIGAISNKVFLSIFLLGTLCSATVFWLYYHLTHEIGPLMTSGVTFLVPLFGILWGWLFLDEHLTWGMLVGCSLIIIGSFSLYRSNTFLQRPREI